MKEYTIRNIKSCKNCPFMYFDYDDFAIGADTLVICNLAQNKNSKDYIIDSYDSKKGESSKCKTPVWCFIKNKPLLLKFI